MLRWLKQRRRQRILASNAARRATQTVEDFDVGEHVRVWMPGSAKPIYGVVSGIADQQIVVQTSDDRTLRAGPDWLDGL